MSDDMIRELILATWGSARTLVEVSELVVGSRRCTGGLLAGGGGEFESPAVEGFLGGGFGGPVEVEVGEPPNLGWDIREAAAAATRPGPPGTFSSV